MSRITSARPVRNLRHAADLFQNRKTLWQMLREVLNGSYKMSFMTHLLIVLGLLYIILPFDFDWIPFLGWIDDGFVALFIIKRLQKETHRFNRFKAMQRRVGSEK